MSAVAPTTRTALPSGLVRRALPPLAVALLGVLAFVAVLPGAHFVFDDRVLIHGNFDLARRDVLWTAFARDYYTTSEQHGLSGYYRPVAVLVNALDWNLWRRGAVGSHATNLVLHALACAALGPALMALGASTAVAWLTAAFFAVHPVHAESVAFVSGRVDVLAGIGVFTALALLGSRRRVAALGFGVAALFAFLSKEVSVVLPLLVLLAWAARPQSDESRGSAAPFVIALGVAVVLALFLRLGALGTLLPSSAQGPRPEGGSLRLALVSAGFALQSLYAPVKALLVEPDPSRFALTRFIVSVLVGSLLWIAAWRLDPGARPFLRRALWAAGICLLPTLNLLPQETVLSERFFYLFSAFALAPVGVLVIAAWRRAPAARPATAGVTMVALVLLGGIAAWRARAWRDDVVLWRIAVREEPQRAAFWDRLGLALTERKDFGAAETALRRAVALDPDYFNAQANLGVMLASSHRPHEAIAAYRKALELQPQNVLMHLNMGIALQAIGDTHGAYQSFRQAVALKPDNPEALRLAAGVAMDLGRLDEARRDLEAAHRLVPRHRGVESMLRSLETLEQSRRPAPRRP